MNKKELKEKLIKEQIPVCHITHYDLDGVVSGIFAKKIYNITYTKCCGYGKIDKQLDALIDTGIPYLIVTDLNFTDAQLIRAFDHFDAIYYYDHHEGSLPHVQYKDREDFEYNFNQKLSASAILYMEYVRTGHKSTNSLSELAVLGDTYDMWRTDNDRWKEAFKLNALFWRYNFFDFEKRFKDGYFGLSDEEEDFCYASWKEKTDEIDNSPIMELDKNSILIALPSRNPVSDVTLHMNQYDVYYILYPQDGEFRCSVRVNTKPETESYNIHDTLHESVKRLDKMISAGGHQYAGGCEFVDGTSMKEIVDIMSNEVHPIMIGEI